MRVDQLDSERVDAFSPTDAGEDVVHEAEELKHVPCSNFALQKRFTFAILKLVLCVCPWPRTFIWSSQS